MKRYLVFGAVLAALLIGFTSISWALDFGTSGSYRLRGFYNDNLLDGDKDAEDAAAYYASQFMLTTKASQDGVSGVVTLLAGSQNGTGNRLLGDGTAGPTNPNQEAGFTFGPSGTSVEVLEAYIKADFKTWALTAGRAGLKFGNGVIMDDWVDGIWADLGLGGMTLTLGTAKLAESTDNRTVGIGNQGPNILGEGPGTGDDADLYFVNVGLGKTGMASGTNVFLNYLSDRGAVGGSGGQESTLWILGAATDLDLNGLKVKAELDILDGTFTPITPGASDVDLKGFNVVLGGKLDAGGIPLGVDLVYTSGQDNDSGATDVNVNGLSGNYPLGIIITNTGARSLGVTDGTCLSQGGFSSYSGGSGGCVGGDGLMAIKLSGGVTHGPHVVDVALIWAQSAEDPFDSGAPGTSDNPNEAGYDAGSSIGIELDATMTWALTKNLSWMLGAGYLLAGDYVTSAALNNETSDPTDNLVVLVTQLGFTF